MGAPTATGAVVAITETGAHKMLKATFLCRKLLLKLANGGAAFFHNRAIAVWIKCRKGIEPNLFQGPFLTKDR